VWCSRRLVTWTSIPKLPVWLTELAGILRSPRADPFEPHLAARYSPHRTPQSPVSSPQSALPRALRTSVFPQSTQTFAISCCPAVEGIRRQQVSNVAPGQVPSCSYTSHLGALGTTSDFPLADFRPIVTGRNIGLDNPSVLELSQRLTNLRHNGRSIESWPCMIAPPQPSATFRLPF
jgi:hypothetical protein